MNLFLLGFAIIAVAGSLYAFPQRRPLELLLAWFYAGSAAGVVLAQSMMQFFVFWECMAIASSVIILCNAPQAGIRYAILHAIGGTMLLTGIAGLPTLEIGPLWLHSPTSWLIFAGIAVNAAIPPFSAWVADSYAQASPTGAVFLSAFTTKVAVYAMLTFFPGEGLLIPIGMVMMAYGFIYAFTADDIRKLLSYAIVNQLGVMLIAIGVGTPRTFTAVAVLACAHMVYKGLLMMVAGCVMQATGKDRFSELGGLYRKMPYVAGCAIIAVLSLAGMPLTAGFIGKTLLAASAPTGVYMVLLLGSLGSALYGAKFIYGIFFAEPKQPWHVTSAPLISKIALTLLALACFAPLAGGVYGVVAVVKVLLIISIAVALYRILLKLNWRLNLHIPDMDWFYRVFLFHICLLGDRVVEYIYGKILILSRHAIMYSGRRMRRYCSPDGMLARQWPIGTTALWMVVLLGSLLMIYYIGS